VESCGSRCEIGRNHQGGDSWGQLEMSGRLLQQIRRNLETAGCWEERRGGLDLRLAGACGWTRFKNRINRISI